MAAIGMAIDKAKANLGLTQSQLAERYSRSENTLTAWRKGRVAKLDVLTMARLFQDAGMSIDEAVGIASSNLEVDLLKDIDRKVDALGNMLHIASLGGMLKAGELFKGLDEDRFSAEQRAAFRKAAGLWDEERAIGSEVVKPKTSKGTKR